MERYVIHFGNTTSVASNLAEAIYPDFICDVIISKRQAKSGVSISRKIRRYWILPPINEFIKSFLIPIKNYWETCYDVYHFHYIPRYSSIAATLSKCILRFDKNTKVLLHFHGDDAYVQKGYLGVLRDFCSRLSNVVLYSTPDLYIVLDRWWIHNSQKPHWEMEHFLIHLPNPIDTDKFKPLKDVDKSDKILLWFSMRPEKRPEEVFKQIKNDGKKYLALKLGKWKYYQKRAKRMGVKNLEWINPVHHDKVPQFLNRFEEVVPQYTITTQYLASIGLSELEAAACGVKVRGFPFLTRKFVIKYHSYKAVGKRLKKIYNIILNEDFDEFRKDEFSQPLYFFFGHY